MIYFELNDSLLIPDTTSSSCLTKSYYPHLKIARQEVTARVYRSKRTRVVVDRYVQRKRSESIDIFVHNTCAPCTTAITPQIVAIIVATVGYM